LALIFSLFTSRTGKNENFITNVAEFVNSKAFPGRRTSDNGSGRDIEQLNNAQLRTPFEAAF